MREIDPVDYLTISITRHQAHSLAMRAIGREGIVCIARHPKTAHTFSYEVCVRLCGYCQGSTRALKLAGYLPVKVQRISRGAEAATPAAPHALPSDARGTPP